ncbi:MULTISPECIES: biotin transporter BioY [Anaerococcus]|uniref:biotin transporter BioY n=1 Tax=Anaerococcus TaxID=165779 RepID=UPI001AEA41C8|nr:MULTISPECIES: biotin transporter BioY [Anaerococcus]MBP2070079.1 biotin transport system substrate-specific component [Anaerococcus nagyae]MDU2353068.1 biotin transporter BioY [Anaerococcus sp.]MDU3210787.1 biotin transporter BioY [Anaerococcus sp.]
MTSKELTRIALSTALIAVGSFITIPLGPVPFTLQTLFVILAGLYLKPAHAALSTFLYMIIGLIGVPIFAGFSGGPQSLASPTFGFIISFIPMAYIISKMAHGSMDNKKIISGIIVGVIVSYLIGLIYLKYGLTKLNGVEVPMKEVLSLGFIPFIIPDAAKILVAIIVYKRTYKYVDDSNNKIESTSYESNTTGNK